ncbi:putative UPF0415 protein C7orf25-like protein [Iris pallida]|uniref:UPF0415 protein C7orf25-like protein n=1 Tax=Iris pallida TaxID=29817 RepID=A0AAX6IB13_IRIPA|nr:putative UPF0415 protein C7orf25-like protein [Iris pallida]
MDIPCRGVEEEKEIEEAKALCISLRDQTLESLHSQSKISSSSRTTLHRLLSAELRFLSRLQSHHHHHGERPLTLNLGYLHSILRVLRHPSVRKVSRVCKPVASAHVDVVCTFRASPAWFFVSARNPSSLSWPGLRARVRSILAAARSADALKPSSVFLSFSRGLPGGEVPEGLAAEFGAAKLDDDGFFSGRVFEIKLVGAGHVGAAGVLVRPAAAAGDEEVLPGSGDDGRFASLVSSMTTDGGGSCLPHRSEEETADDVVNFDTTALVALVSGISNGGSQRLLEIPEAETRSKFKGNYDFVVAQAMSELEHPILAELGAFVVGKKGIICESVYSEFKELVMICGGPNEKLRADLLIKRLLIVRDSPSERVAGLPTTRKVAMKNKITFGTGDYWQAPTLTANMGFVRAISQIGMSLLTVEHRPRALIGD